MNILDTIGNTPLIELPYFSPRERMIYAKLEGNNPGGSIKDRIALSMLDDAEREGVLFHGGVIVEATSGNTGIGLAMVAAAKGYKCIIVMPENMSDERKQILRHFGAELVLTPAEKGMTGAIEEANKVVESTKNAFMPDQFSNPTNPTVHRMTTAPEIERELKAIPTAFVAGVGTAGTIMGIAQYFKLDCRSEIEIIAVEPEESAVLSGETAGSHGIQGIGAGFVPPIFDRELVDTIKKVSTGEAIAMARELATEHGIGVGISSAANLIASIRAANRLPLESNVVTIFPDRVDRYLSAL